MVVRRSHSCIHDINDRNDQVDKSFSFPHEVNSIVYPFIS